MFSKPLIRKLLLVGLVLAAAGGYYAYQEYNRRNPAMADVKADHTLTMQEAMHAFNTNPEQAKNTYLNKVLEISGQVVGLDKDEKGLYTVVMGTVMSMTSIRCVIDSLYTDRAAALKLGDSARVRGVCVGYNADDMGLGSDILLNRCYPWK